MTVVRPAIPVTDPARRHRWTWAQSLLLLAAVLILLNSLGCGGAVAHDATTPTTPPAPSVSISPGSVSFGNVTVGTTGSQTVTLTNNGNAALGVSGMRLTGEFTETNDCGASIPAGSACHISVSFKPTVAQSATGTLTISDTAAGSPHLIALSGTGVSAPAPSVALSVNSLSFASQVVKTTSPAQAVKLSNTGTAALSISAIAVSGDFSQTNNCGSSLAASNNCTITVTFAPTQTGTRTGALTINDNSADSPQQVTLSGTGAAAPTLAVAISPNTASINTGATYQFSASVTGTTNNAVTWSVVSGGGTISSAGLYTAPSSATTATIKATSVADTTKSATATATVTAPVTVAVAVSPGTAAVSTGSTVQFTAIVTGSTAGVSWSVVSGGGAISSSGLYTAPSAATTAIVRAVSNSDALASDTATITVTAPSSGNAGCGATGTYPNLVPLDQSACGNVGADGSPLSYEPGYNDGSAAALNCGSTVRSNGSYKLNTNLSCGAGSLAFQISPANGANNILINLNGHSVTGYIQVNEDGGHVAGGIHVFNGTITCNTSSANGGACIFVTTSNGAAPPSAANIFHHLTIQNSADSSSAFVSDGSYSSPMTGAQATGGTYSDVYHHLTITVVGGTITGNRAGGGGVAGNNRTVHYYNLKITNGDSNTNHYTEGIDCYDTYNCDVHNNYFAPNRITTGDTPGRMILLDGDAYGNGPCTTCMTLNAHVYNNYFNANDVRAIRHRSAKNVNAHDNLMDNVQDPPANISNSGVVHFGDMTSAGPGGTGVYDLGNSIYKNNVIVFTGPIHGSGPKAFADGYNAKGVTFTDNRIMCSGTGCSGITDSGHAVNVGSQNLGTPRYADVKVCNFTYDSPLPTPLHIDGSAQTQTSYLRNNNAGACSATAGAQCVAVTSCQ